MDKELIDQLNKKMPITSQEFIEFVMEDRKRICAPLLKALEDSDEMSDTFEEHDIIHSGIEETLKLAGLND